MNSADIYLMHAEAVFDDNQYTCLMFRHWESRQKLAYQNFFGPACVPCVPLTSYWWSRHPEDTPNKEDIYAHKARVFALLFAHELAKTGDMGL